MAMAAWPAAATCFLLAVLSWSCPSAADTSKNHGGAYVSAIGDPGMQRDGLHVAWEAWNFCNEVGQEAPGMGSPRGADCFDLGRSNPLSLSPITLDLRIDQRFDYSRRKDG
jgi:hypothetical protein